MNKVGKRYPKISSDQQDLSGVRMTSRKTRWRFAHEPFFKLNSVLFIMTPSIV